MGWVEDLRGKTVGLDTAPLILYIEDHPTYAGLLAPFFEAVRSGETRLVTSTVTLLEVLVHPLKHGDESLAHEYNDILLSSPHIFTVAVTPATAQSRPSYAPRASSRRLTRSSWRRPSTIARTPFSLATATSASSIC